MGATTEGIDFAAGMVEAARRRILRLTFREGGALALNEPARTCRWFYGAQNRDQSLGSYPCWLLRLMIATSNHHRCNSRRWEEPSTASLPDEAALQVLVKGHCLAYARW
jgi:hypothetical protein